MFRNVVLVILFGLAATCGSLRAVDLESIVIDTGDIDRLIIKLPARHEQGQFYTVPYADSILDWKLLPRDPDSLYKIRPRTSLDTNNQYYWLAVSGNEPLMFVRESIGLSANFDYVAILRVGEYMAYSYSFFSFWKRTTNRIELVKLLPNPSQRNDWACLPLMVGTFPDGSHFVGSCLRWGDVADRAEYYYFARLENHDSLVEFYSLGSSYDYSGVKYTVDDSFCGEGSFQLVINATYFSGQVRPFYYRIPQNNGDTTLLKDHEEYSIIDSAKAEIIDLWQEAIRKFNIDTTQIE